MCFTHSRLRRRQGGKIEPSRNFILCPFGFARLHRQFGGLKWATRVLSHTRVILDGVESNFVHHQIEFLSLVCYMTLLQIKFISFKNCFFEKCEILERLY